ncbi:hypothetical protein [Chenggangzhangella methanolivorans]|uniref:Peptidase S8/S53 domain-containing protein n=1 Tax=Chenggangzhangella methanolivorans TaxID=1437009 RepID=A0A9E6UR89_9HYPH|nr:hypothetical protein [Chenggangzhangella methanolivorans]QZO02000.1 hypothetical protein K6K41_12290 [Chenggangzhangella methanolivorans]
MIERAVRALKEGVGGREPVGPDVLIINHSLGDMHSPFERRASHWSRLLDYLSHRYNVLFIVSAGNAQDGLPLDGSPISPISGAPRPTPAPRLSSQHSSGREPRARC